MITCPGASRRIAVVALALALTVSGCADAGDDRAARALHAFVTGRPVAWNTVMQPHRSAPGEFDFTCQSPRCRIDSRAGTYTWLLGDSTDHEPVARFALSAADRDTIWSWMLRADAFDFARAMPVPQGYVPVFGAWEIEIRHGRSRFTGSAEAVFNGPARSVPWPTRGRELATLVGRIEELIERKPEVRALPHPVAHPLL